MKAMVLEEPNKPLRLVNVPRPSPSLGQLLLNVTACGICRTDLHIVDGELTEPKLPLIPGHQIVGEVVELGEGVSGFELGQRVGVPWLGATCSSCQDCREGRENLCDQAQFTGYQIDGGFAEYTAADAHFCFPIPAGYPDVQAAPLLCAGLIGYRSYTMVGDAKRIGFYGFGSAAHILIQLANHDGREVYAFSRAGDGEAQKFARRLGATWAGDSESPPPQALDAAIIFAPVGSLIPTALRAVRKGGTVVCAGIYMSEIPAFPYEILWGERVVRSVANLTRQDGEQFMALAPQVPVRTEVTTFPLEEANEALDALREGRLQGAGVLVI